MSKTPYEVRLDVLKMAQEMLEKETNLKESELQMKFESVSRGAIGKDFFSENKINMYSTDELLKKANELYTFVSSSAVRKDNN